MSIFCLLRIVAASLVLHAVASGSAFAQPVQAAAPEHELKAAFIYHFIQFTQWPKDVFPEHGLVVCASRDGALFPALQALAGKQAGGRPIILVALAEARPEICQAVVVTGADRPQFEQMQRQIGSAPVLTITDDAELLRQGTMIGMRVDAGKMSFVVDNTQASRVGLNISSRLLRLARRVQ